MRSKVTLVLVFLNVVLFFYIFDFERNSQTEHAMMEARRRVLGAEASNIRSLEVSSPQGGVLYRIEKRGESWFLTSPAAWPANPSAVSRIINELQFLEHETSFSVRNLAESHQTLADFGLEQPRLVVTFTSGDSAGEPGAPPPRTTVLRIGDTTRIGLLYLLSPDGQTIHVVGHSLADSLDVSQDQLRSENVFTIPVFEASFLSIQSAAASGVRVRVRRDPGGRWFFETPVTARASKSATELAINGLDDLRVNSFVSAPPSTEPSAAPAIRISLEGNNRQETLFVGAEAGGDHEYYAQIDGRSPVFTVILPPALLEDLSNPQDRLRDPRVLDFDANAVTSITLSTRTPPDLVLQRLDAATGTDGEAAWQIIRRDSSAQSPQPPLRADPAAVRTLLAQLAQLEATGFQSDVPTDPDLENWGFNSPERVVTLALAGTSQTPVVLEVGLPGRRNGSAYARVLGPSASVYAVDPDILRATPVSPLAWRDRGLYAFPAAARITALSLTDTAGGPPLYARRLAAGETWDAALAAEAPARKAAVAAVLDQLHNLRARTYVQEGFPTKVFAAGEVRPWRYRLDATVSLPGGERGGATDTVTLWLAERTGSDEQLAGSERIGAVVRIEQPLLDALWALTNGARDPGPPPAPAGGPQS